MGRRPPRRTLSQRSELIYDLHEYGVNADAREVFIAGYPDVEEEPGVDWRMANRFIKNMSLMNQWGCAPVIVRMTTVGGEWPYGMAMYDAIVTSRAPVAIIAYAHARSMSSIILQAAKLRLLTPESYFMIHFGTVELADTAVGAYSFIEQAKIDDARMLEIYARRCVKGPFFTRQRWTKQRIATYLDRKMRDKQELYLDAEKAVDYGFADGIFGTGPYRTVDAVKKALEPKKRK